MHQAFSLTPHKNLRGTVTFLSPGTGKDGSERPCLLPTDPHLARGTAGVQTPVRLDVKPTLSLIGYSQIRILRGPEAALL